MDVVVAGSIVIDLISYTEKFPTDGETIIGTNFEQGFGGKGANQAIMANKLGAWTGFIGNVGDDSLGQSYIEHLIKEGIDTSNVKKIAKMSTGTASILVRTDGCNRIIVVPGANYALNTADIDYAELIIKQSKVMLCQLEIPFSTTMYALAMANKFKVKTILNPAPAPDIDGNKDWHCLENLPSLYIFCPNETEAAKILKCSLSSVEDARGVIQKYFLDDKVIRNKIKFPMITLGQLGVVFGDSEAGTIHHVPVPKLSGDVKDTTGAGDCFLGSLAFFIAKHPEMSMEEAVGLAVKLASISVRYTGTQSSFPDLSALK